MTKRDLIKKERTVYGYDILEAVHMAFEMAKDQCEPINEFNITETSIMALMDDDAYEKLHILAKKNHEKAMEVTETLDKIINTFKELFNE